MTRPLLPAVEPSNGTGSVPSRAGSEHGAPVAPCVAVLARIAELHEALAQAHQELAQELEDCLAAGTRQSDVMDVPGTETAPSVKPAQGLLSAREVADRLGVSATTVRRWRREGRLPKPLVLGGVIRWRAEVIDRWLEGQER